jgi:Coatomer epsilon subunit
MSVIFRTLKKLKTESTGAGKSIDRRVHRKKIFAFNSTRLSPSSVFLLFVVFTALGAGSLFGYIQVREKNSKKVEAFLISSADIRQSTNIPLNAKNQNKGERHSNSSKPSTLNSIEYRPPDAIRSGAAMKDSYPTKNTKARLAVLREKIEPSHIVSKIQAKQPDKSSTSQESTVTDVKKLFLSNAKKNAKIARLVTDIQREMDRGDKDRIEKLFNELAVIRGQNNSYVLKLKAVWHLRNQEYEDASDLLKTVLSRNGRDLEAGLNMAIVEINTGKEKDAYRRLETLQQTYPDNIRLAEILQDLRRLFNGDQIRHLSTHNG